MSLLSCALGAIPPVTGPCTGALECPVHEGCAGGQGRSPGCPRGATESVGSVPMGSPVSGRSGVVSGTVML
jgi:hypothetical protein